MKLIEINWNPSHRQLRQFGFVCMIALPLIVWIWGGSWQLIGTLAGIGLAIAAVGLFVPMALKYLFLGLSIIAIPIGLVIGELATMLIYFGVFLPIGLVFRIMSRDALQMKLNRNATTYWQPKKQPSGPTSYYRQS